MNFSYSMLDLNVQKSLKRLLYRMFNKKLSNVR